MTNTYCDEIGIETIKFMDKIIHIVKEHKPPLVKILINSGGGDASCYDILEKQVKELESLTTVVAINLENCFSASFDWFMMYANRAMTDSAKFLIHNSVYSFSGKSAEHIKKNIEVCTAFDERWMNFFLFHSICHGMKKAEVKEIDTCLAYSKDIVIWKDQAERWGVINIKLEDI
ncbi:MAG: hypothetical protein OXF77_00930 [Thaumarchaeota archaeon]|nr:hypothetical protein [Nitrososphaerota archaeon]